MDWLYFHNKGFYYEDTKAFIDVDVDVDVAGEIKQHEPHFRYMVDLSAYSLFHKIECIIIWRYTYAKAQANAWQYQ